VGESDQGRRDQTELAIARLANAHPKVSMSQRSVYFDDAAAYEAFMGRWSRSAGDIFLDWIAPPENARWLDVGCGTGVFTELIVNTTSPAAVTGVDPTQVQIDHARRGPIGQRADFQIADAQMLPFPDNTFDLVVSALVFNFIPDPTKALAEMRRVGRAGGIVAGYVWDFAGERSPGSLFRTGLHAIGVTLADLPGSANSGLDALRWLFERSSFDQIATKIIDVTISFANFDDLWRSQTPQFGPRGKSVANLSGAERARLIQKVRASLPAGPEGSVAYSVRAHAIKARIPA
jgi:ubiquinone/menaquinone biosynthesis C-methylase UbiE